VYIHDHLISAIGSQKYHACLCLLDISAVFDTTDYGILITRLSFWFGIHGPVLSWFKSYLSSRCFHVKCESYLSSWHTSSWGVPQGSVLGPLLFVMYTTPLSTLISSCSLNQHLYAEDTQLFLSFLLTHFDSSTEHFPNALNRISSWMTANPLTLNSCQTEHHSLCLKPRLHIQ